MLSPKKVLHNDSYTVHGNKPCANSLTNINIDLKTIIMAQVIMQ